MNQKGLRRQRKTFGERYDAFVSTIRSQILSGTLQPGDALESEQALAVRYNISRGALRKGLAELAVQGLIVKAPGRGNFIAEQPEQGKTTIRLGLFTPNHDLRNILALLQEFERTHPFLKVHPIRIAIDNYTATVRDLSAQEGVLDLFMLSDAQFRKLNPEAELLDLTSALGDTWRPGAFFPQLLTAFRREGRLYAAPFLFSPVVLCYNKELFDADGLPYPSGEWSWEEFLAVAKRLTRRGSPGGVASQFGFCLSGSRNRWPIFLLQNQARLRNDRGEPSLADSRVVEAIQFATDLMYRHGVSPIYAHGVDASGEGLFTQGRIGMILTTHYFMQEFRDLPFGWDVAPPFRGRVPASIMVAMGLAVNRRSPRAEAALELIRFLTGEGAQAFFKTQGTTLPAVQSIAENRLLQQPGIHPAGYPSFAEVLPYTRTLDELGERALHLLESELELVWSNLALPGEACQRAQMKACGGVEPGALLRGG